jgi:UDP-N-acetylmuramoyl-L-alanyl-D-glutamate--2,6-diaminopimelate ligase
MENKITRKLKNYFHLIEAVLANLYYGFPGSSLKVIGVTGTDGKTTTAHLVYHILKLAGKKVSMISTVYAKIADKEYDTGLHTTTPGAFLIQKLLRTAVEAGDEYFILETTSHALDQNRVYGINYDISVVTNITHEHLDYHQNYGNYLSAKAKLILNSKIGIINKDDRSYARLKELGDLNKIKIVSYGIDEGDHLPDFDSLGLELTEFNRYNYTAAYALAQEIGVDKETIFSAMKTFKLPIGRLETVYNKDFKVVIDFAHTPNAIDNVLQAVKKMNVSESGRIIHVFGSAGLRDRSKRALMGAASGKYADIVILTEEDYRTEDPFNICQQIGEGLIKQGFQLIENKLIDQKADKCYTIITNREKAIRKAVSVARKGDIIIVTGKSHEKSLCRGKTEYPWDEKKAVLNALPL